MGPYANAAVGAFLVQAQRQGLILPESAGDSLIRAIRERERASYISTEFGWHFRGTRGRLNDCRHAGLQTAAMSYLDRRVAGQAAGAMLRGDYPLCAPGTQRLGAFGLAWIVPDSCSAAPALLPRFWTEVFADSTVTEFPAAAFFASRIARQCDRSAAPQVLTR